MQVNLHGTLCIPGVFLKCFGHIEKQNLAQMSPRKYAISILKYQKFSEKGALLPPQTPPHVGRGTPPPHTLGRSEWFHAVVLYVACK